MLVGHLMVGLLVALFAALLSLALGLSGWAALAGFVLGGNIGVLSSAAVAVLSGFVRSHLATRRAQRRGEVALGSLLAFLLGLLTLVWSQAR